ncbi:Tubulin-folding cofactor D [Clarias magur]|uniref:Tubulin-folding cofactor D n=1 Tax=Clarias magur TaxID=1594786 RepID=A0A8J4TXP3_CLAMG|nr:Tubulin-folding cofactor D [Clarias magur]
MKCHDSQTESDKAAGVTPSFQSGDGFRGNGGQLMVVIILNHFPSLSSARSL